MKFSENWLRELVEPGVDTDGLAGRLTMAGLEVEAITPCHPGFHGVVAGKVLTLKPHPESERLSICVVDAGDGPPLTVVCGAENVVAGGCYPYARPGATLPGIGNIDYRTLLGVESAGMLCSAAELGLSDSAAGLYELPVVTPPGSDIAGLLQLDDNTIELSLTPNRGDCLSLSGIAREVALLGRTDFSCSPVPEITPVTDINRTIRLDDARACPRYCGRVIGGINPTVPSPLWLTERLRRSDIRSISIIVDLTNYVMLECGQPMHAFDNARLTGEVRVRFATSAESLRLLDGQERKLDETTLVIADEEGAVAMAGIMGGLDSAVSDDTREVFLESAYFSPDAIMGKARVYGMHTDASHRFERGVDPAATRQALEKLSALIIEYCGGHPGPVTESLALEHLPQPAEIHLRSSRIARILGVSIPSDEVEDILGRLGFDCEATSDGWDVGIPVRRFDIRIEVDLIEEIARVRGYQTIEGVLPANRLAPATAHTPQTRAEEIGIRLVTLGYSEAITYSFVDPGLHARILGTETGAARLLNPISTDLAVMRQSLWPGLLQALIYNLKRQSSRLRLFEKGHVFRGADGTHEISVLAGLTYGNIYPKQWDIKSISSDFYSMKANLELVLSTVIDVSSLTYRPAGHPALHPGQSAEIFYKNQQIGVMGRLHPRIAGELDLVDAPCLFEIDLVTLPVKRSSKYVKFSKYPSIRRDLSILIDRDIPVAQVIDTIHRREIEGLNNLQLFDVYHGEGIDLGKKSLALGLTFQRSSSTLTDEEADNAIREILQTLQQQLGAKLRE